MADQPAHGRGNGTLLPPSDPTTFLRTWIMLTADEMERKAVEYFDAGSLSLSKRYCDKLLASDPDNIAAHFYLTRICWRKGMLKSALHHAKRVLQLNPSEGNAFLNLGLVYESLGNLKMAVTCYRKELAQNPFSGETLFNIGHLYFGARRWKKAITYLLQYVQMGFPFRQEDALFHLGNCYSEIDDLRGYIDAYTRYVSAHPNTGWALANLGSALLRSKDYKEAILKLSRAKRVGTRLSVDRKLATAKRMLERETKVQNAATKAR